MAILKDFKSAVSEAWRKARAAARQLDRALGEPRRIESDSVTQAREESVFQPRKH